jgi:hypothetical protein
MMNSINHRHVIGTLLLLFVMSLFTSPAMAKVVCYEGRVHPQCPDTDPPPEPEPDPDPDPVNSCANSGSDFPAFVYQVKDQLLLSNAAGDCRIAIYKTDFVIPWGKSFRYFPEDTDPTSGYGRLAWYERDDLPLPNQLYTVEFHIDNGAVVETLPLTPTPLTMPESDIGEPAFSADASQVYATGSDTEGKRFIDVFDLERGTRDRVFETKPDENTYVAIHGMEPGLEDRRLYFRLWPLFAPVGSVDYTNSLVYIERDENGNWPGIFYDASDPRLSSEPTVIIVDEYSHESTLSIGFWDYDDDGELNTVLSQSSVISPGLSEVEILDIENCVNGYGPCFILGSRSMSGQAYEGGRPSLTSFSENPPSLLARRYDAGYDLIQLDLLDTVFLQTLIEAKNKTFSVVDLDSAD